MSGLNDQQSEEVIALIADAIGRGCGMPTYATNWLNSLPRPAEEIAVPTDTQSLADQQLRMDCLRLAIGAVGEAGVEIARAEAYYQFIKTGLSAASENRSTAG